MKTKMSNGALLALLSAALILNSARFARAADMECGCAGVTCERNVTAADCPNGRVLQREDCPCCLVCAKQLTEKCNSRDAPCDSDFGLVCGPDGKCQAAIPCSDDTGCGTDRFCISGACANPCKVRPDVCKNDGLKNGICVVRNHRAMCSCPEGLMLDSAENECVERLKDVFCLRGDKKVEIGSKIYSDKCTQECKCKDGGEFTCKPISGEPDCAAGFIPMTRINGEMSEWCKILTGKSDFDGCCVPQKCQNVTAPDDVKGGRGFKLADSHNNLDGGEDDKIRVRDMLLKNEQLEEAMQAADVDEAVTTIRPMEEESSATTLPQLESKDEKVSTTMQSPNSTVKCHHNGMEYSVGQILLPEGCDEQCECSASGKMECIERCSVPFFKKGSFAHDPMCFEEPSGEDECCVIVACARTAANANGAGEPRVLKLEPESTTGNNPCDKAHCGPNSVCRYEVRPSGMQSEQESQETLCFCKEGYIGNPNDEKVGCSLAVSTSSAAPAVSSSSSAKTVEIPTSTGKPENCKFNNKTYDFGQEDFDGCSYKCKCETSGEMLCRPRCAFQRDEEKEIPPGCEIRKDESDGECCEKLHCPGQEDHHANTSSSSTFSPSSTAEGCVYKNETHPFNTKFYDGCEQQCMCLGNGDVTCQARCPPAGPNVQDDCLTLPDPSDKCCTVTVCDPKEKQLMINDVMRQSEVNVPKARLDTSHEDSSSSSSTTAPPHSSSSSSSESMSEEHVSGTMGLKARISSITPLNDTSVMVSIKVPEKELSDLDDQTIKIYHSTDMSHWAELEVRIKDLHVEGQGEIHTVINGLLPMREYYFKALVNGTETETFGGHTRTTMGGTSSEEYEMTSHEMMNSGEEGMTASGEEPVCKYKGQMYHIDEEFFDKCDAYCMCEEGGTTKCVPIQCPEDLGLEILDPDCLRWEAAVPEFERKPPACCQEMRCVQNATCIHEPSGLHFKNYEEIPKKLTGCDKECYCQNGNITCINQCPPVADVPPKDLKCPPELAMLVPIPPTDCCRTWVCRPPGNGTAPVPQMPDPALTHVVPPHLHQNITDIPLHHHEDQFVPPSTGNQPSYVPLNKINRDQLQDLLHQLSQIGGGEHHHDPEDEDDYGPIIPQGTYVSVKDPKQLQELERAGAKIVEQVQDGSFVVFIPQHDSSLERPEVLLPPHSAGQRPPGLPPQRPPGHPGAPPGFPFLPPHFNRMPPNRPAEQLHDIKIQALNESTLQIDFIVSPVLVGLHGHVIVLYSKDFQTKTNPDQWERQEFQQKEQIIDNNHMQLFLLGLEPDTDYHLQIQVVLRDLQGRPSSQVYLVRTPPPSVAPSTLPPEIDIDPELQLADVSSNSVKINWRKFSDAEGPLIDGVQIKYKAEKDQVYSTTPLIHRSITSYELTNLQHGQSYEIDMLFIPFTNQTTELRSMKPIHVTTLKEEDPYDFTIAVETGKITETTAELKIEGVPYPEDKFVNIYQVIYQSDLQKEQKEFFKVAKRESTKGSAITDLKPGTRYRVWVEAFLTNGKKRRSNVIDVLTKAGELPQPDRASQDKLLEDPRSKENIQEPASYSGAVVALAIVATLAILGIVVLLMVLLKRQSQAKAPISDRKSESSYDNPSFKNYDVESNGHANKPGDA